MRNEASPFQTVFTPPDPAMVKLTTRRTLIRPAHPRDSQALYEAARTPGFLDWMSWDEPANEAALVEHFETEQHHWRQGTSYCLSVVELGSEQIVGGARLKREPADGEGIVLDLGYWTHPRFQRQGYATEYLPAVLSFAFGELHASEIVAAVAHQNEPSRNLLLQLGFVAFEERPICTPSKRFANVRYKIPRTRL